MVGVRVEMPSNQPIVLLREAGGDRYLPIWIGAVEATAIAFAQQGQLPPRPLTHDLFRDVLDALRQKLERVDITELRDGVFFAELRFSGGVQVSARPSDAIALALRTGTPIYGAEAGDGELARVRAREARVRVPVRVVAGPHVHELGVAAEDVRDDLRGGRLVALALRRRAERQIGRAHV